MAQNTTTTLKLYTRTTLTTLWAGLTLFILAQTSHAQQSDSVYQKMPFYQKGGYHIIIRILFLRLDDIHVDV